MIDRPEPVRRVAPAHDHHGEYEPRYCEKPDAHGFEPRVRGFLFQLARYQKAFASDVMTKRTSAGFSIDVGSQRTDVKA